MRQPVSLLLLTLLPVRLREAAWRGTAVLADEGLIDFEPENTESESFAVAVDVGTTTLVAMLVDLNTGEDLAVASRLNPQTSFGDDVLSRILHAQGGDNKLNELHELRGTMAGKQAEADTAMMTAEVRHIGEMAQVKARHEGETGALRDALGYERQRAADLEEEYALQGRSLAERTTALERAAADLDRQTAQANRLAADLRNARRAAKLTGTINAIWTAVRETKRGSARTEEIKALEDRLTSMEERHRHELAATQARYEAQLGAVEVRDEEQIAALRDSLVEEQKTVYKLEERLALMTEKLITAVMQRGQLTAERERLAEQVIHLEEDLRQVQAAVDLSRTLRDWWASVRTALRFSADSPEGSADHLSASR